MNLCHHDEEALTRMFAAQKHLRARLLALRLAQPNAFRMRALQRSCAVHDEDEIDAEILWLTGTEAPAAPHGQVSQPDETREPVRRLRCA